MAKPPAKTPARTTAAKAAAKRPRDEAKFDAGLALAQSAHYVNSTHVMTASGIVRIAFGESSPGATVYSSAVAMSSKVARTLGAHLIEMADHADEQKDELVEGADGE